MREIIVNLGRNKGDKNDNSSPQIYRLHNSLLISIVGNPEKYLSNVVGKADTSKVRTSSVKSYSTLFSWSACEMYNRVHHDKKQRLVLRLYIPGIDSWIDPKRYYIYFSEMIVNELHE